MKYKNWVASSYLQNLIFELDEDEVQKFYIEEMNSKAPSDCDAEFLNFFPFKTDFHKSIQVLFREVWKKYGKGILTDWKFYRDVVQMGVSLVDHIDGDIVEYVLDILDLDKDLGVFKSRWGDKVTIGNYYSFYDNGGNNNGWIIEPTFEE